MQRGWFGFTLVELLIALAILGIIATFTIPKIIQSHQSSQDMARVKEVMAMISGAYDAYKMNNTVIDTTGPRDLTPYMNYVRVETNGEPYDREQLNAGSYTCSTSVRCLRLHSGAILALSSSTNPTPGSGNYFGELNNNNFIFFRYDPDGTLTSSTDANGAGKTLLILLYANGKISTCGKGLATDVTYNSGGPSYWCPGADPLWYKWN